MMLSVVATPVAAAVTTDVQAPEGIEAVPSAEVPLAIVCVEFGLAMLTPFADVVNVMLAPAVICPCAQRDT